MYRFVLVAVLCVLLFVFSAVPARADDFAFGFSYGHRCAPAPVYVPPPVYAPPPVLVEPPVVMAPPPVFVVPRAVVVPRYYCAPRYRMYGYGCRPGYSVGFRYYGHDRHYR